MRDFTLLIILFLTYNCNSQNCIDYPLIDGPVCTGCAPAGWTPDSGAEEIEDPNVWAGTCNFTGPSPTGGNVVGLHFNSGFAEGISTTVDVVAGVEYNFLIWWFGWDCSPTPICCSDFIVELDGQTFTFPPDGDWSLVDICITASSSTMDIVLTGTLSSSGTSGQIFIDDALCPDTPGCCALQLDMEPAVELCVEQAFFIETDILFSTGGHTIEWTCDPVEGLDYLNDLSSEEPTFFYPDTDPDFEGEKFNFTLTVSDGSCIAEKEICIEVSPIIVPTFDFEGEVFCETDGIIDLPTTSDEGIFGTWDMNPVDPNNHPGQLLTLAFFPDASNSFCVEESEHNLEIENVTIIEFDLEEELCRSEYEIYDLDTESENGIFGSWYLDNFPIFEIVLEDYTDGDIQLEFIPDNSFCINNYYTEIPIVTGTPLTFDIPNQICAADSSYLYPEESLEGIDGFWETCCLDLDGTLGTYNNTFVPSDQNCYQTFNNVIEIISSLPVTFDTLDLICRNEGEISLSNRSNEGFLGTWDISKFNPDTILLDTLKLFWTPNQNQGPCVTVTSVEILLIDPLEPIFNLPSELCASDPIFTFPPSSINNVVGDWSIVSVDPNVTGTTALTSTFTPLDSCASNYEWTINLEPLEIPTFSFETNYCKSISSINLPMISDNGISGSWNTGNVINPSSLVDDFIDLQFIPNTNDHCADEFEIRLEFNQPSALSFDLPSTLCFDKEILILPLSSNEGINGMWNEAFIDPALSNNSTISLVFTPEDPNACYSEFSTEIQINAASNITLTEQDPTSCELEDGRLIINASESFEEFSLDGIIWQSNPEYSDLTAGQYLLHVRNINFLDCIETFQFSLTSGNAPIIIAVEFENDISCLEENGWIEIIVNGIELEYSIDEGVTWLPDNLFSELTGGNYSIQVREVTDPDCIVYASQAISTIEEVVILDINITDPSDCQVVDGEIEILATGDDLEYSIDNGLSWSPNPLFTNLADGQYEILVQSAVSGDCLDSGQAILSAPDVPIIVNIEEDDPSTCLPNSGTILIESNTSNVEFSIDNMDWQADPLFQNLVDGIYEVVIRSLDNGNCFSTQNVELELLSESLEEPIIDITNPSACDSGDGSININNAQSNYEYSIDDGISWLSGTSIDNLMAGSYTLWVRIQNTFDCEGMVDFMLVAPDCPCPDLNIDFEITDIFCVGDLGEINITNISGMSSPDYNLLWDNSTSGLINGDLNEGTYMLTVNYDGDCEWIESFTIDAFDPILFNIAGRDSDCESSENGIIEINNASGGSGKYTYSIDGINYQDQNVFSNLPPYVYTLFVKDENDCIQIANYEIIATTYFEPQLPNEITINQGESISLNPLIDEMDIDSFAWSPIENILNPNELIVEVRPDQNATYILSIYFGECMIQQEVNVTVNIKEEEVENDRIYISNMFSRNQANNDNFHVQVSADSIIEILNMSIYDRWGNLVFSFDNPEVNNPDHGWDGTFNERDAELGVYIYVVKIVNQGSSEIRTGNITLVR